MTFNLHRSPLALPVCAHYKWKGPRGGVCVCVCVCVCAGRGGGGGGGGKSAPPWYWSPAVLDMNSKLLDNFSYDLIESLVKYFFDFFPTLFRKLTSNDLNARIFSIEKTKKWFFFSIFYINDLKYYFRIEWQLLHIFVGPKIKILGNRPDFLIFSAKMHNRL